MQRLVQRMVLAALLVLMAGVVKAQVFEQQGGKLYANGGLGAANFGAAASVSADGNVTVIGAPNDNEFYQDGAFYIFRRTGTSWAQEFAIHFPTNGNPYQPNEGYAVAVSADGTTVAVGGYFDNKQGSVWIYRYSGGNWTEQQRIQGATNQELGTAVSLSSDGNTALIGSYYNNSAEVWQFSAGAWSQEAVLPVSGATGTAEIGKSVSLSADGNTALVGGDKDNSGTGAAWVFTRSGGIWTQQGSKITANGLTTTSNFGYSVSISGDASTLLIGAYGESGVYAFTRIGGSWTEQGGKFIPDDFSELPRIGASVSLSNDGNTAIIGGTTDDFGRGAAWIYKRSGGVWTQLGNKLVGSNNGGDGRQGSAVSLSADGKTAIVGGYWEDNKYGDAWAYVQSNTPVIMVRSNTGAISACQGSASANPYLIKVRVIGTLLTGNITASAPANFEISLNQSSGFGSSVTLTKDGSGNADGVIYVRSRSDAPVGSWPGNITLTSAGATTQTAPVSAVINAIPTPNPAPQTRTVNAGANTSAINFIGTAKATYKWTNSNTAIGLAASGTGDIPSFLATNSGSAQITGTITATPITQGYAYVVNSADNNVSIVNTSTGNVEHTTSIGAYAAGVTVSPDGSRIYTLNNDNTISVIDAVTGDVIKTVTTGYGGGTGIRVSPDGSKLYSSGGTQESVLEVNTSNYATKLIHTGDGPNDVAISPDNKTLYVVNYNGNSISVINTQTNLITATIALHNLPKYEALSPDGKTLYVSVTGTNEVAVINTQTNTLAYISVDATPAGIVVSPDNSRVYVASTTNGVVSVIDPSAPNPVIKTITVAPYVRGLSINDTGDLLYATVTTGQLATINTSTYAVSSVNLGGSLFSIGNFVTTSGATSSCPGTPVSFDIIVNPPGAAPAITATPATGTITGCAGSVSTNYQQFSVTASLLTSPLTATAPTGFEISLDPATGYATTLTIPQQLNSPGNVSSTVYVRAAANATAPSISADVKLTYAGATAQTVQVTGTINALPTVTQLPDQVFGAGQIVPRINFSGNATTYNWSVDNTSIGITAPSGTDFIPQFRTVVPGALDYVANITVTPVNSNGCTGAPMTFKMTVPGSNTPGIHAPNVTSGSITACKDFASFGSDVEQFTVSGNGLTNNIVITPTSPNFEIATSNYNFQSSITLSPISVGLNAGTVNLTVIYVRSSATAPGGPLTGVIHLQSGSYSQNVQINNVIVNLPGNVNSIGNKIFAAGVATEDIKLEGTATSFKWESSNQAFGLRDGSGDHIPSFIPENNTTNDLVSTVTVYPNNPTGCNGPPVRFTITVPVSSSATVINVDPVSGTTSACLGMPSSNTVKFAVSGSNLTHDIVVSSTSGNFEISTDPVNGFNNIVTLRRASGSVASTDIYVRSAATATGQSISGTINVNSGTFNHPVPVTGAVNAAPVLNPITTQVVEVGTSNTINFQGTTNVSWVNDNTAIGLPGSGMGGNIKFTATSTGTANIVATPYNSTGCTGAPIRFSIVAVLPVPPNMNASGNVPQLNTIYGTSSTAGTFAVSGDNMRAGITVTPPSGFEVSTDDITFSKTLTVGKAGTIASTTVYIRISKTTPAGTYPGDIVVSSTGISDQKIGLDNNNAVSPAPLTITADNKSKITGRDNPVLTVSYKGFVNGESTSVLKTNPLVTTTAVAGSEPGIYPITASGALAANYAITYVAGSMTIKPQPLSVTLTNTFTPNGDGLNDTWVIKNIEGFTNCTVQVYNRYGASVFYSVNYPVPWDGKSNGTDLPVGTYYYIIDLKNGDKPTTGWLAIIR